MKKSAYLTFGSVLALGASATPLATRNKTAMVYDFEDIKPSKDLHWTPCFETFTCAKVQMPLDYTDLSAGTVDIAWIKQDASSSNSSTPDILLNPGGPSVSGVLFLVEEGNALRERLGPNHNLVSFDPRGVNSSGPIISCFGEDRATEHVYNADSFRPINVDLNNEKEVMSQWQMARAYGEWCTAALKDGPAKYANTVGVVGDMFRFLELRAKEAGKSDEEVKNVKLRYYGQSYGSVLGMTAALIHPDRIERMIVDAIHDLIGYFNGEVGAKSLEQADEAVRQFYTTCHEAGPKRCMMYEETPEQIEARANKIMDDLEKNPLPFADANVVHMPQVLTVAELKTRFLAVAYDPLSGFPAMDIILAELEKGNATIFAKKARGPVDARCGITKGYENTQTQLSIMGIDSNGRTQLKTPDEYKRLRESMKKTSRFGEGFFGNIQLFLRSYGVKPPASQVFTPPLPGVKKTLTPLLFATNTIDPVTPYSNAVEYSQMFEGAGLLVQNATSHATNKWPSKCSDKYFQQYLQDGTMPPKDTVCQVDARVFFDEAYR